VARVSQGPESSRAGGSSPALVSPGSRSFQHALSHAGDGAASGALDGPPRPCVETVDGTGGDIKDGGEYIG
jgi:hypothetical protein